MTDFVQKFALGAKVEVTSGNARYPYHPGTGTVTECVPKRNESYRVEFEDGFVGNYRTKDLRSAESIITQGVKMLSALAKRLLDERTKKFFEVGFITNTLEVTSKFQAAKAALEVEFVLKGKELTSEALGTALEELADEEIAEKKKNKCDC